MCILRVTIVTDAVTIVDPPI